jgi:hypothetical protein
VSSSRAIMLRHGQHRCSQRKPHCHLRPQRASMVHTAASQCQRSLTTLFTTGSYARMNQFVPQLMLGNPLDGSSGPPDYKPLWNQRKTWVFGAQYFFEIFNATKNATQGHAATGTTYVLLYQHLSHTCTSCTPAPLALTHPWFIFTLSTTAPHIHACIFSSYAPHPH